MKKSISWTGLYGLVALVFLLTVYYGSKAVTVISESMPVTRKHTIVLDAGHGGIDGGTSSATGRLESTYNLEIALCLNDLLALLGYETKLVRDSDSSVYTKGETIAQKKVSDLKERVRIVNSANCALLVSIHQNHFPQAQYSGAQVFYAPTERSENIARALQNALTQSINIGSTRRIKKADNIYLMQHIHCPGVLIECGFISNPQEAYLLAERTYQKNLCSVIACAISDTLNDT